MRANHVTYRVISDKEAYLKKLKTPINQKGDKQFFSIVRRNKQYKLHVIIPAMNEEDTISHVLDEVNRLQPDRIIVVVNGSTDQTANIARSKGATVIHHAKPLGNDLGRAIGSLHSNADIYLFTDADIVIKAEDLLPFVQDIENGKDVSINSVDNVTKVKESDSISLARFYLNFIQKKPELRAENVLTIPHAFSEKALIQINKATLTNPVLANSVAADLGLAFSVPHSIDVLAVNKIRPNHLRKEGEVMPEAMQRMHGDALEALDYLIDAHGPTLHFPPIEMYDSLTDAIRLEWQATSTVKDKSLVLAIPNYSPHLKDICSLFQSLNVEIIPVVNRVNTEAIATLKEEQIPHILIDQVSSISTYFFIGSQLAQGNAILFHSADIAINKNQAMAFYREVLEANHDITLNDQSLNLQEIENMNITHIGNRLLSVSVSRLDLDISSLLIPPFALKRTTLSAMAPVTLQNAGRVHVIALEKGFSVSKATYVESDPYLKSNESLLLAQQLDGFSYLLQKHGVRAAFTDGLRLRELIHSPSNLIKNTDELLLSRVENMNRPSTPIQIDVYV